MRTERTSPSFNEIAKRKEAKRAQVHELSTSRPEWRDLPYTFKQRMIGIVTVVTEMNPQEVYAKTFELDDQEGEFATKVREDAGTLKETYRQTRDRYDRVLEAEDAKALALWELRKNIVATTAKTGILEARAKDRKDPLPLTTIQSSKFSELTEDPTVKNGLDFAQAAIETFIRPPQSVKPEAIAKAKAADEEAATPKKESVVFVHEQKKETLENPESATFRLSEEQQRIFELMDGTNDHMFVTGKAGTGKSALLHYFKAHTKKNYVVSAPTGVAALNVGGQTIHSLFGIPVEFTEKLKNIDPESPKGKVLRAVDTVIIDEVSMVRADVMEKIDERLKQVRENDKPFGGAQMIMVGDLYQLPPVVNSKELDNYFKDNRGGYYFFNAEVWQNSGLSVFELQQIFRQKDPTFKNILNSVRVGEAQEDHLEVLKGRVKQIPPSEGVITLATTNKTVTKINSTHLQQLPGREYKYEATISGNFESSAFPTEQTLRLKEGAQVMMLRNSPERLWVNGTIGTVERLTETEVHVNVNGEVHAIPPEVWAKVEYKYDKEKKKVEPVTTSSFEQRPLRLAAAETIHKSQGQTLDRVILDMGSGAFAHGQTYVGLSRCTSLEGLSISRPITAEDIFVDTKVKTFMANAK